MALHRWAAEDFADARAVASAVLRSQRPVADIGQVLVASATRERVAFGSSCWSDRDPLRTRKR